MVRQKFMKIAGNVLNEELRKNGWLRFKKIQLNGYDQRQITDFLVNS